METKVKLLAALLAVQIALAAAVGWSRAGFGEHEDGGALLALTGKHIDRIVIEGPEGETVDLRRQDGTWVLPSIDGFPAASARVRQLLDRLAGLQGGVAVATSVSARSRFKVADESFERRITLASGEQPVATLYLGTSPALRRVHARVDDQDAIYAIELAAYEVPADAADWEDKTVLQLPEETIQAMEVDGLRLERMDEDQASARPVKAGVEESAPAGRWHAPDLAADRVLRPGAAAELSRKLAQLRIGEVLGTQERPEYNLAEPLLVLAIERDDGTRVEYRLGKADEQDLYTLKVSTRPEYFRLPAHAAKALLEASDEEALLAPVPDEAQG